MLSDGQYKVNVTLSGGSGKAGVSSPALMTVENGEMNARIEWSSPNYDYMQVDGLDYYPVNKEGNSVFEIYVDELDKEIPVKAETTAMSQPHMIDYTLRFSQPVTAGQGGIAVSAAAALISAAAAAAFAALIRRAYAK